MSKQTENEGQESQVERINDSQMKEVDLESNLTKPGKTKIEVREKKGLLRSAIPKVSVLAAWIVLFLNVFVPGSGTLLLSLIALCGAETDLKKQNKCLAFLINLCTAFLQSITAIIIIGWIWSVYWGMYAVTEANQRSEDAKNEKRSKEALNADEKERLRRDDKENNGADDNLPDGQK